MLTLPSLISLQFVTLEENEGLWTQFDLFYDLLAEKLMSDDKWDRSSLKKGNVSRVINGYKHGNVQVNKKLYVSFSSILRFSYHNKDLLRFCDRLVTEAESRILCLESSEEKPFPRNIKEIYEHISQFNFKHEELEQYFFDGLINEDEIPGLYKDYKVDFSSAHWNKIIFFEYHWSKKIQSNLSENYNDVLESKWSFFLQIEDLLKFQNRIRKETASYMTEISCRRKSADLLHGYVIESAFTHVPVKIDSDVLISLEYVLGISEVFCVQCEETCDHEKGIHVYIETNEHFAGNHDDVDVLVSQALLNHNELCQGIVFFKNGLFEKYRKENVFQRLHFRDALQLGLLKNEITFQVKKNLCEPEERYLSNSKCDVCFAEIHSDPAHWRDLDIRREWALYLPLQTQAILEAFVNQDYLQRNQQAFELSPYIKRKIVTLYCAYDCLLNVSNMKYSGILQEMNTFELAFIHHNIGAMFNITSQSGASQSFKTAEKRLKAASEKENCYFKTYIKKYPIEYETMAGNVQNKINLRQCYNILGMDNLVRLTTKRDPLPDEGRTNQVCTLPLTIKGLPKDHAITEAWHDPFTCDLDIENCVCKKDSILTKDDAERCIFALTQAEQDVCRRFRRFATFGWADIWCQKEMVDSLREQLMLDKPLADNETAYLNESFESIKIASETRQLKDSAEGLSTDVSDESSGSESSENDTIIESNALIDDLSEIQLSDIDEAVSDEHTLTLSEDQLQLQQSSDDEQGFFEDEDLINVLKHIDDKDMTFENKSISLSSGQDNMTENKNMETSDTESIFGFTIFKSPPLLCRHPPPAVGRDDDIYKLKEVLDDVLVRTGNTKDKILIAADHKIASNLFKLIEEDKKYAVFLKEFPLLHLRKSKIVNICSGYKDAGIVPMLMYLHDDDESDWMKLVNIQNIEIATRNIKRLSATLHISFLITFMKHLPKDKRFHFLNDIKTPSSDTTIAWEAAYLEFMNETAEKNATFALHKDIMSHLDEVLALAIAERIGGPEGYDLLLGTVKEALPFSFVNGASSYGAFCIQLLTEHYKSGIFYQNLKKHLFTGPHKCSLRNFALDAQREMEHKDALKGFRPRATTDNVVPRMSVIDEFMEIQTKRQQLLDEEEQEDSESPQIDIGCSVTKRDMLHILPTVSMILRNNVLETTKEEIPVNAYKPERPKISKAVLDKHSLSAAKFLIEKHLAAKELFEFSKTEIKLQEEGIPIELKNKVKRTSGTTVRRSVCKVKETIDGRQSKEVKRKKKVKQKQKEFDCLSSEMNACQAILKPDCTKGSVNKSLGMRTALMSVLQKCVVNTEYVDKEDFSEVLKKQNLHYKCCSSMPDEIAKTASVAVFEFAGVKFKTKAMSGLQYLKYVQNTVLGKIRKMMPHIVKLIVCEEKYQFTPDDLKAYTRESRKGTQKQKETIQHLKQSDEMLNTDKFNKKAILTTSTGKSAVGKYLAENLASLKLKNVTLDVDSELYVENCEGCLNTDSCECKPFCIPVRAVYGPFGFEGQEPIDKKQRKGEAEMSQSDWLVTNYGQLNAEESIVSVVTSGDIDAVAIHLFSVSLLLPRNEKGEFNNKVYVMLQKQYGLFDIYNITDIVLLLEKTYGLNAPMKTAIALCMGGNDFVPKFHGISHQNIMSTLFDGFLNNLLNLKHDNSGKLIGAEINQESYINLMKVLYCPKRLLHAVCDLTFEEIRQISIKDPKKTEYKHVQKWLPPRSVLLKFVKLIDCQIDYLFTLGHHEATLPDFVAKGCLLRDNFGNIYYDFGGEAKFSNKEDLLVLNERELSQKLNMLMQSEKKKTTTKRSLQYTPQKGKRMKERRRITNPLTSTPR